MKLLITSTLLFFMSCGTDVSIMKVPDKEKEDTNSTTIDSSDTTNQSPSSEPDSQEPGTEPAIEPSNEMSDLIIGYGEIYFRQIACPMCVGSSGEFEITSTLKLHQPTNANYVDYLTAPGTCTTNVYETYVASQPLQASQPAYFNNIQLYPNGQGNWHNGALYEYQYQRNTAYTVTSEHGVISNAFISIEGFDDIQPYTLLWIDPSYAFDAVISKSGTNFSWQPIVQNSQFEIIIAVYTPDGSRFLGAVSCVSNDMGYMFVPGSYFQSYPTWALTAVHLIRHRIDYVPVQNLNGHFQSHMKWEVVGTGHIE